ncbi:MAG: universal stress protein [Desulfovibrionaceae bacterium]|jgi:nucleotide-binding universal stress UspA family protein|nr:universal stress protein [Desulfovibrionaceae bacterium]
MIPIRTILCGVDFSEMTPVVAKHAAYLAKLTGANVVLVYVAPKLNQYAQLYVSQGDIECVVRSIAHGAKEKMKACLDEHFQDVEAKGKVKKGYAPEGIIETAKAEGAQLIILGTHGRKGVDRILFGSVAEKVVKTSPIPVLTIRPI